MNEQATRILWTFFVSAVFLSGFYVGYACNRPEYSVRAHGFECSGARSVEECERLKSLFYDPPNYVTRKAG